jgi:UDP-N-acetylglucosamine 2-epimerase (non-hydrolysing)
MGSVMGDVLRKSEEVFIKEKPDAVMILGDTNSAIAAVVAERMHIPVYHMEAGNRSFDANVPEELNRKMVDHVATFNLPYTSFASRNLLSEGIHPRFIHKTGSPIREIFNHYRSRIQESSILETLELTKGEYFLVSVHRQENVDSISRLSLVLDSLREIRDSFSLPLVISTHPRTKKMLEKLGQVDLGGMILHEPFGYLDYNKLQLEARGVVSDSGSVSEEAAIMGFPAVTLRNSLERPEALEAGTIHLSAPGSGDLSLKLELAIGSSSRATYIEGYEVENFSDRVLAILQSTAGLAAEWKGWRKPHMEKP